ncbi:MAG: ubiquinol oxidase subunit II [Rhodocyclaceae bacterium]|nr:ubiquinol oxidase subunit II [Rhodocyclaceae bacterium]
MVLLSPSGDIAVQQKDIMLISVWLMLIVIVPVMFLTLLFAWKYRSTNTEATYSPEWHHSTILELVIWSVPLIIIIALGAVTWVSTHSLDPYRPIERISEGRNIPMDAKPLVIEVVAMDWKWLFIYPEQNIALVNELAAPVDRPIEFRITSTTMMNSLYIPALAGQIYAMPGMQTQLHAVINKAGDYEGFSGNYSGAGFSHMRFRFHGVSEAEFAQWVEQNRKEGSDLTREAYLKLEQPSEREPVQRFAKVDANLFDAVLNRCVESNRMCIKDMVAIDRKGGMGESGTHNLASNAMIGRRIGLDLASQKTYVGTLCAPQAQADAKSKVL